MYQETENQNKKAFGAPLSAGSAVREVEAINGYYKKVVLNTPGASTSGTQAAQKPKLTVTHRDGAREPYDADKINQAIERAASGLSDPVGKVAQIASETELAIFDGITTEDLDQAIVNSAVQNIKDDPEFDIIASRLLLKTMYKKALGDYSTDYELEQLYRVTFAEYISYGVEEKLLDRRMGEVFDLSELARSLDPLRDELLRYTSLTVMQKRYLLKRRNQRPLEVPQYFWMRVAMGLSFNEQDPTAAAKMFYRKMSSLEYVAGGSTNVNAGTNHPTLSNCYLMEMQDDIDHIGKTVWDVMKLSKATGGIGLSVTKLRAEGSPIRSNNTFSSGPIPFMHTIDSTLRAVSRAGKKMGALCFYMENWHLNFPEFLDLRQNAGDEYRRTRTANTAVYLSDEFMKRVKRNDDWYLFDPFEVSDLNELFGAAFSRKYAEYVAKAEAGKLRMFKKVKAREQFRAMIMSLQTTAHPWLTWKDTINVRALNNNTGTIHLSNLCTEITLPQDRDNVSVCNLASINLARHLSGREIDWPRLERSVRIAVRQLDNLLDINQNPIPEAVNSDEKNRAIGLGMMGFTDTIEQLGFSYDSDQAYGLIDRVMEFISYMAIEESAQLAQERGSYPNFSGSGWSRGWVPIDTLKQLEAERGEEVTVVQSGTQLSMYQSYELNWDILREKVKRGMRNATLMAIAPTANIGLVAGTTPGIDPQFAQMFSRTTNAGKFLELNRNLVNELKRRGLWEQCKDEIIARYGDLSEIAAIPDEVKAVYTTSFRLSPEAFIEVASRAQKWIDQSMSRNMYLATRDVEETMKTYITAWEKGLKTTYYLHLKPRHQAEQSTSKVNKSTAIGKAGFGIAAKSASPSTSAVLAGFGATKQNNQAPISKSQINSNIQAPNYTPSAQSSRQQQNTEVAAKPSPSSIPDWVVPPKPGKIQADNDHNVMVSSKGFGSVTQKQPENHESEQQEHGSPLSDRYGSDSRGFGAARAQAPEQKPDINPDACPVDPSERLKCDSCQ